MNKTVYGFLKKPIMPGNLRSEHSLNHIADKSNIEYSRYARARFHRVSVWAIASHRYWITGTITDKGILMRMIESGDQAAVRQRM